MDEFLNWLNWLINQAYIYIPAVLAFITAIGIPSIVQLAKIFKSAKLYLTQTSVLLKKLNESLYIITKLVDFTTSQIDSEIAFYETLIKTTYNKKQKMIFVSRIEFLKLQKETANRLTIQSIDIDSITPKKKIKVRIKQEAPSESE